MAPPTPRATTDQVSGELDGALAASEIKERWLQRAARLVAKRLPNETDDWHLEQLEILTAAHIAYPHATDGSTGERVSRVSEGEATVEYELSEGPGGHASPYWTQALEFDPRMESVGGSFTHTL